MTPHRKLPRHAPKRGETPSLELPGAREAARAFLHCYLENVDGTLALALEELRSRADYSQNAPWPGVLSVSLTLTARAGCNPLPSAEGTSAQEFRAMLLSALHVWMTETFAEAGQSLQGALQVSLTGFEARRLFAEVQVPLYSAVRPQAVADPDRASFVSGLQTQKTEWTKSIFAVSSAGIGVSLNGVSTPKRGAQPPTPPVVAASTTAVPQAAPWVSVTWEGLANGASLLAAIVFSLGVFACLRAFDRSSEQLGWLIKHPAGTTFEKSPHEDALVTLSRRQTGFLLAGVVLLVIAAAFRSLPQI